MGIHNSFSISTVWRVANQINMKAFVTICSFLASSACADSQYLIQNVVPVNQPMGIPAMSPYGLYSAPLSPVNYANVVDLQVETPFTFDTTLSKREAEPDTPYVYKSKVNNPEDGSNYEIKVQVDRFGNGQSHQQIETQPTFEPLRDNYLIGQRMHDDLSQNMRMDNRQMSRMMSRENVMNQRMRDQGQMESRMYSMVDQRRMDNMNQRMQEINMRQRNMDDSRTMNRMTERNQMQSRRMIKREADPSFQYTIAAGHPASQSQYRMGLNMRDQVFGNGLMNQRMAQGNNLMRMNSNLVNQMVRNNMMKGNQMQSHGMIKREADSFIPLSFPTSHLVPYAGYQVPSIMGYTAPLIG